MCANRLANAGGGLCCCRLMTILYLNHDPMETYLSQQGATDDPLTETKALGLNIGEWPWG